ncbi:MAG TPA: adenosylcobinamide-phosphate synthase CbiB [Methylocella sp.]|nr:adenosylcobinamide-phosphate synthase CbiB [Methylocella sp.]
MIQHFSFTFTLTAAAFLIEGICGYPSWLYNMIGHPVSWIGKLIAYLDQKLNCDDFPCGRRRALGFVALAVILLICFLAASLLQFLFSEDGRLDHVAFYVGAAAISTLIAQKSLYSHVDDVAAALKTEGLAAGRITISKIVGRNVQTLDASGISRAAIESLAENFADGVVAPVFWTIVLGASGGVLYKAINTADSMIGHRTARFEAFGYAAAKLDDLVNFIPARLTALMLCLAASTIRNAHPMDAWRTMLRDSGGHPSPNAGWPEAAAAGALSIRLGGPRIYGDEIIKDAFIGSGSRDACVDDIGRALTLYRRACALTGLALILGTLILAELN